MIGVRYLTKSSCTRRRSSRSSTAWYRPGLRPCSAGGTDSRRSLHRRRQRFDQLLAPLAGRAINNAGAGRRLQKVQQRLQFLRLAVSLLHFKVQVRPRKASDEGPRLLELKLLEDVAADVRRGRGGQS